MHQNDTPADEQNETPSNSLVRGMGYIAVRKDKLGRSRFRSRWRYGDSWRSKTFDTHWEAEQWLVRMSPPHMRRPTDAGDLEGVDLSLVYFIQGVDGGLIKIGKAMFPERRLKALQSGSPVPLRIIAVTGGGGGAESLLHRKFKHLRVHREWFRPGDDLLVWIRKNATTLI